MQHYLQSNLSHTNYGCEIVKYKLTRPFLFLIVAKGLAGFTNKAIEKGLLMSFKIHDELKFHILQFVDDTILMVEVSWDNMWGINTILTSFELVLRLKVNLCKSKLDCIIVTDMFLDSASTFLSCRTESLYRGRVTLINFVLISIPLYFFSF